MERTSYTMGLLEALELPKEKTSELTAICVGRILFHCMKEVSDFSRDLLLKACLTEEQLSSGEGVVSGMVTTASELAEVVNADLCHTGSKPVCNIVSKTYNYLAEYPCAGCNSSTARQMALFTSM